MLTGRDAPFYGQANTVRLQAPAAPEWARVLQKVRQPMHPSDLGWLLDCTRGRVATTIRVLEMLPNRSPRTAWRLAVRGSRARAHDTLLLAREIHAYAPTLLLAIAQNQKPYPAVPGAKPARVALALRKLQAIVVTEQPELRAWQIADHLLQHALISLVKSMRAQGIGGDLVDHDRSDWARAAIVGGQVELIGDLYDDGHKTVFQTMAITAAAPVTNRPV